MAAGILLLTAVLGAVRFATGTPDSVFYLEMLQHFRGEVPRESLEAPFAYRPGAPWLAAWLPLPPAHALAALNLLSTAAAFLLAATIFSRILADAWQTRVALLLLIVSFGTVNYSSRALVEGPAFLVAAAGMWLLLNRRYLPFLVLVTVGVLVRESLLFLLLTALIWEVLLGRWRRAWWPCVMGVPPLLVLLAARGYIEQAPDYVWLPGLTRVWSNFQEPIAWATVSLTIAPLLAAYAYAKLASERPPPRLVDADRALLHAWIAATGAYLCFSITAAYMSGRFAWPMYLALCPLIANGLVYTPLGRRIAGPLAALCFGRGAAAPRIHANGARGD